MNPIDKSEYMPHNVLFVKIQGEHISKILIDSTISITRCPYHSHCENLGNLVDPTLFCASAESHWDSKEKVLRWSSCDSLD